MMLTARKQDSIVETAPLVLLVGGSQGSAQAMSAVLKRIGQTFLETPSLEGAVALVGRRDDVGVVLARCESRGGEAAFGLIRELRRRAPLVPVVLFGRVDDPSTVVEAMRGGAADFVAEQVDGDRLARMLNGYLKSCESAPVFESAASRHSFDLAARVARTDVSVLITGESGTGKEVVARFIHERSDRADGPFVGVNCAAIPEQMMEATLFGHERGAFTGAHQARPGKFEVSEGGTLLLDEISEMGLDLQAKLLRVLQEREVERIGAHDTRAVDVRVLATSNRDLREEVRQGRFREDLFYRLSVFPLRLEPLRERVEDILPLARWFLCKHGARMGKPGLRLSKQACDRLVAHAWIGNVRELENAIQRALVLVEGDAVEPLHLGIEDDGATESGAAGLESRVRDAEESVIQQALASCNGRRKDAARALGISERTLRYKLQKLREREEVVQ
ncbi:MAG: sigma-54 dependent transcriptional regulator [Pseudomonadales bacterium]